jgi:Asp-tRNA(Asn)/Glu-tRNA(Gln) amidotransferase A subunit family amidase
VNGIPVGIQIQGKPFEDPKILGIMSALDNLDQYI